MSSYHESVLFVRLVQSPAYLRRGKAGRLVMHASWKAAMSRRKQADQAKS
jgi:hypothetical protein